MNLRVNLEDDYPPEVSHNQILIAPRLQCEPDGLRFNRPVSIIFVHHGVDLQKNYVDIWCKTHDPGRFIISYDIVVFTQI